MKKANRIVALLLIMVVSFSTTTIGSAAMVGSASTADSATVTGANSVAVVAPGGSGCSCSCHRNIGMVHVIACCGSGIQNFNILDLFYAPLLNVPLFAVVR